MSERPSERAPGPDMVTGRFLLGRGRHLLAPEDLAALEASVTNVRDVSSRQPLQSRGEPVPASTLLVSGYVCRYMDDREGYRQIVAVHVPGDFVDLHGYTMQVLDHDIVSMGPVQVASVDHGALARLTDERPRLARALWFSTLLDAAMHREWIFRLGRLGAEGRMAHLFSELEVRLDMVGLSHAGRFALPFTQADLGEACGITGVHANRVLRRLRENGTMTFAAGEAALLDKPRLHHLAEFDPHYLYGGGDWAPRLD